MQEIDHCLHGLRDDVGCGEVVSVEHSVEDGLRERVLHEHVGGLVLGDGGVQVLAERGQELHELVALRAWGGDDGSETFGMAGGDLGDLLRPERPVAAGADLLHHLGVDLRPEVELVLGGGRRGRRPSRIAGAVAFADDIDDDLSALALVELDLVDFGVEVVVMRAERVQDRPDDIVDVGIVERLFRRHLRRDDDGDDDIAVFLSGGAAHHASDGLDDVHLAVAGGKEQHGVERGNVHALGKATHVREDMACVRVAAHAVQPCQFLLSLRRAHGTVDMVRLDRDEL